MAQAVAAWGNLAENRRAPVWCATVPSHAPLLIQLGSSMVAELQDVSGSSYSFVNMSADEFRHEGDDQCDPRRRARGPTHTWRQCGRGR